MLLKYLFLGCLSLVGAFAFAKRDGVLDAFDWGDPEPGISVPAFDAVARAQELQQPPPELSALRVVEAADTRGALLPVLPGAEPIPPSLQGGTVTLSGTVSGPGGAVAGATVRIERFVGESVGSIDLQTDAAGGFALRGAPGGRYRLRAWQAPTMAQLGSQVAFLAEGEQRAFALQLTAPSGSEISPDWSASGWVIGSKPVISVTVQRPYVTSEGRVELAGQPGLPVTLTVGGTLVGSAAATTNGEGAASFEVTCAAVGPATANLRIGPWAEDLTVPACAPPPTTTTATTTTVPGQPPPSGAPTTAPPAPPALPAPGT